MKYIIFSLLLLTGCNQVNDMSSKLDNAIYIDKNGCKLLIQHNIGTNFTFKNIPIVNSEECNKEYKSFIY